MKQPGHGVEEELNRFLLIGQRRTAFAMVGVCCFIAVAQLIYILSAKHAETAVLLILPAIFIGIAILEWLYARQIGRHLRERLGPLRWASLITAIGEASLPSTGVILFHFVLGWEDALRSPPVFGYFIMLALSVLRLDTRVSVTMGLIEAATLSAILFYAVGAGSVSQLQMRFSISSIALILVTTVVVAVTIRFTRSLVFDLISTQRNKAMVEQELATTAEAHQRAEEIIWHKDRLFAILGHDLRTPLNGVAGLSEWMARAPEQFTAEEIRRYAGEIHQTSRHLRELVENLLAWAQLRTGQMEQTQDECFLDELVAQTFALHEVPAKSKQVRLEADAPGLARIVSDTRRLQAILRNLVSNAVKFTPAGGLVKISAQRDSDRVAIVVRNTGSRFPESLARQITLGLAVPSSPGTAQEAGLGIGLLLSHELAISVNGSLEFKNEAEGVAVILQLSTADETHAGWRKPPNRLHHESPASS